MTKEKKLLCIYTSIINNYDSLPTFIKKTPIDFIAFANTSHNYKHNWKLRNIKMNIDDPVIANRFSKINIPEEIFINYDYSLYIDGNILIKEKLLDKVHELIDQNIEFSVNKHPRYDCPYSDLNEILRVGVVSAKKSLMWAKRLRSFNIKRNSGYYECNILLRKHNNKVKELNDFWWKEFLYLPHRDQPGFRVAFEVNKETVSFKDMDLGNTRLGSNFFATAIVHNTKKPIFKRLFVRFCSIISGYEYFFKVLVSFIPKVN